MINVHVLEKQVNQLWIDFTGDNDRIAREKLLLHYLPLVKIIAGRMKLGLPGSVEFDELVSSGMIGLINSIDNFNLERGFKFETYAAQRIRGSILDGLRDADWLPRSFRQKSRKLEKVMDKLVGRLGQIPTNEEIASELGLDIDAYFRYIDHVGAASLISLDRPVKSNSSENTGSLHEVMPDESKLDPYEEVEDENIQNTVHQLIAEMSEQERTVVALYYFEALTFREIGEVIGVSESRICQIHTRLIATLRANLRKMLK